MNRKGFTLIELLVVIAIIGILSSVVLASLNSARNKGANAAVQSGLANMRAQAELYYSGQTPNGYAGVCTNSVTGVANMLAQATSTGGGGACFDDANGWSASANLKTPIGTNNYWCVGNSGASKAVAAQVTSTSSCQ